MNQLQQMLETIKTHMGRMTPTHRLLIASLAVIVVMGLFLVSVYSGRPALTPLLPMDDPAAQARAADFVRSEGAYSTMSAGGVVLVRASEQGALLSKMTSAGQMPTNTQTLFENLVEKQNWTMSKEQNRQLYMVAFCNELSKVIAGMSGIESAQVFLDVPEARGLGPGVRKPTGSVIVSTAAGQGLDQGAVDAIARLVSSAVSGLSAENVTVTDATTRQARAPTSSANAIPTQYLDYASGVERQYREKILNVVNSFIPGAIVEVTAQVDVTRSNSSSERSLPAGEGTVSVIRKESVDSTLDKGSASVGKQPGVQPNTGADIAQAGSEGSAGSEKNKTESEFETRFGTETKTTVDPGGRITGLAASVGVPSGSIAALLRHEKNPDPKAKDVAPATVDEIKAKFEELRPAIEAAVKNLLIVPSTNGVSTQGTVVVSQVAQEGSPVVGAPGSSGAAFQGASMARGGNGILAFGGGLVEKGLLGGLAVVALGMMFVLVKRAGKRVDLPSVSELAGVPPTLDTGRDVVGEADEGETPLAGIEVGEEEIKVQKMLEQVSELVKTDPGASARLLNRWIQTED